MPHLSMSCWGGEKRKFTHEDTRTLAKKSLLEWKELASRYQGLRTVLDFASDDQIKNKIQMGNFTFVRKISTRTKLIQCNFFSSRAKFCTNTNTNTFPRRKWGLIVSGGCLKSRSRSTVERWSEWPCSYVLFSLAMCLCTVISVTSSVEGCSGIKSRRVHIKMLVRLVEANQRSRGDYRTI